VACHPDPAGELDRQSRLFRERLKSVPKKEKLQLEESLRQIEERKNNLLPHLLKLKKMAEQGRKILLPLVEREIPLILDEWAKPELGSGCVKITPAHDPNDYDVWTRHHATIGIINILNPDGTLNANAGPYAGLDRFEARDRVIADLENQGLMEEIEDREIEIGHSDRSKTAIEPYLSKQWFIRMGDVEGGIHCGWGTDKNFRAPGLAQAAMDAIGREYESPSGLRLTFYPDHARYGGTYKSWLSEKRDWCISRQLWWGHRIPIWLGNFSAAELDDVVGSLAELKGENIWAWISDQEGRLHPLDKQGPEALDESNGPQRLDRLRELDDTLRYDLLVCLRNEAAEEEYADKLQAAGLNQDPDVLDTWFSSALWPFSTLGWPDPDSAQVDEGQRPLESVGQNKDCLETYYPGSCLVTARDIITLWVARMNVMGLFLLGDVPFTDCFIHANIQDGKGERMSKSKGNGIDPEDIIDKYGADSMRYVLCDMQTGTQDIRLPVQAVSPFTGNLVDLATAEHGQTIFTYICPETQKEFDVLGTMPDLPMAKIISERFDTGRAFCTKLWNAARFALINLGEHTFSPLSPDELEAEDRWILSRLSKVIAKVTGQLYAYNPSAAIGAAREFFWSELCDWYLEFIKPRFRDERSAPVARSVLSFALDQVLRLFHPFVPFITEVLWERLHLQCPARGVEKAIDSSDLLITAMWPQPQSRWIDDRIETDFALVQEVIRSVRDLRSRYQIPPSKGVDAKIKAAGTSADILQRLKNLILHLGGIQSLEVSPLVERPPTAATQVVGDLEVYLIGVIDPDEEIKRLRKQKEKLLTDAAKAESNLHNPKFLDRAPSHVVDSEKKKLKDLRAQIELIDKNLGALSGA
jgi:valyl-tRNA synthetase